jgi:putative endonuclease
MAEHNEFGKRGEEIAAEFLRSKGYEILELNWRRGKLEIDIVAKNGKQLVIVEVKSRHSTYAGEPETAVNREKQRALIRAANAYVLIKKINDEVRFDIISILIRGETQQIHYIEDAFYPMVR